MKVKDFQHKITDPYVPADDVDDPTLVARVESTIDQTVDACKVAGMVKKHAFRGDDIDWEEVPTSILRAKPVAMSDGGLKNDRADSAMLILGLLEESGELAEAIQDGLIGEIEDEAGDVLFYLANLCELYGFDLATIMQQAITKAKRRTKEFTGR